MRRLRVLVRFILFWLIIVAAYVGRLAVRPLALASAAAAMRARQRVFRWWGRTIARAIGMKVRVEGSPPSGPFFLVSNHLSYVDIALYAAHVDAVFIAKRDVKGWPFLGPIVAAFDTIFIDRENARDIPAANGKIAEALARGEGVVLFAEGTSSRGAEVLPIKSSLLQYPAERGVPVSCSAVSYRTEEPEPPASTAVCWWGDAEFLGHFREMLAIRRIEATVRFGKEAVTDGDRKRLAAKVHAAISGIFEPVNR
jgi:1-acyl-sn-glycerol-3-phosphate acyltransferase